MLGQGDVIYVIVALIAGASMKHRLCYIQGSSPGLLKTHCAGGMLL